MTKAVAQRSEPLRKPERFTSSITYMSTERAKPKKLPQFRNWLQEAVAELGSDALLARIMDIVTDLE